MQRSSTQPNHRQAPNTLQAIYNALQSHLTRRRDGIIEEIRHYPPPIPACDVQYNCLLEERTAITHELKRLERLGQTLDATDNARQRLDEFICSSGFIDQQTIQTISAQAMQVEKHD